MTPSTPLELWLYWLQVYTRALSEFTTLWSEGVRTTLALSALGRLPGPYTIALGPWGMPFMAPWPMPGGLLAQGPWWPGGQPQAWEGAAVFARLLFATSSNPWAPFLAGGATRASHPLAALWDARAPWWGTHSLWPVATRAGWL